MGELKNVCSSPHIRKNVTTSKIMLAVIIALMPASIFGVYNFGINALVLILVSVGTCVISEFLFEYITHRKITIGDFSAVVTGLLLALNLPSNAPWWIALVGGIFAIVVVKQFFGGLGQNFMNPALAARCFLLASFSKHMTTFVYQDAVVSATPLAALKSGGSYNLLSMFLGNEAGTIGETSAAALLIGAVFLLALKVINLRIAGTYLLTFTIMTFLISGHGFDLSYLAAQLCSGGLMLGAFFMATDYVTSPITPRGQILFGVLLGILTGVFRFLGQSAEGVSYAIILGNLVVPFIEKATIPKPFGKGGEKAFIGM